MSDTLPTLKKNDLVRVMDTDAMKKHGINGRIAKVLSSGEHKNLPFVLCRWRDNCPKGQLSRLCKLPLSAVMKLTTDETKEVNEREAKTTDEPTPVRKDNFL